MVQGNSLCLGWGWAATNQADDDPLLRGIIAPYLIDILFCQFFHYRDFQARLASWGDLVSMLGLGPAWYIMSLCKVVNWWCKLLVVRPWWGVHQLQEKDMLGHYAHAPRGGGFRGQHGAWDKKEVDLNEDKVGGADMGGEVGHAQAQSLGRVEHALSLGTIFDQLQDIQANLGII